MIYFLLFAYSIYNLNKNNIIDTKFSEHSVFITQSKYLVNSLYKLDTPDHKFIFLGASNVRQGFFYDELDLYGMENSHNLSLGASNIYELGQLVDLVFDEVSPSFQPNITFIICPWYGVFVPSKIRWPGDTDIDVELKRYPALKFLNDKGIYRNKNIASYAYLPIISGSSFIGKYYNKIHDIYFECLHGSKNCNFKKYLKTEDSNNDFLNAKEKMQSLINWNEYMGNTQSIFEDEFVELGKLIDNITNHGSSYIIVDMPIPNWHATSSPYQRSYEDHMSNFLDNNPSIKVNYHNLNSVDTLTSEENFYDSVHFRPKYSNKLAERVSEIYKNK